MDLNRYIQHPEILNRETLYDLRSYVALYPYNQVARTLMLQNLYLLHDPTFGDELRQAAFYIADRTVLFNLVEGKHYQLAHKEEKAVPASGDRTDTLITNYLDSLPEEPEPQKKGKRRPTAQDASVDYVSYLLETGAFDSENETQNEQPGEHADDHSLDLIDDFLENEGGKLVLKDDNTVTSPADVKIENDKDDLEEGYFTETLAKIYIRQGNYLKALEIIQRLNLIFPKKSAYFADQMRYLEKIILIKQ